MTDLSRKPAILSMGNSFTQIASSISYEANSALDTAFAFGVSGAEFSSAYREKGWDGKKHMYNKRNQTFPTGLTPDVVACLAQYGYDAVVRDIRPAPGQVDALPLDTPLWEHQQDVLRAAAGTPRGLVQVATGGGKSRCIVAIYSLINRPGVIFTQKLDLLYQLKAEFEKTLGIKVGILGDGQWEYQQLTIAMVPSLMQAVEGKRISFASESKFAREVMDKDAGTEELVLAHKDEIYEKLIKAPEFVAIDECLPYHQRVLTDTGPKAIGQIFKSWQNGIPVKVLSFNKSTDSFEWQKVTYGWKRNFKPYLRIAYGPSSALSCTADHPILTSSGWKKAGTLKRGDSIIAYSKTRRAVNQVAHTLNNDQLQIVLGSVLGDGHIAATPGNHYRLHVIHGEKQKQYIEFKARILGVAVNYVPKNGYAQTPAYVFNTKAFNTYKPLLSGKKTEIPDWVLNTLDYKGLAVWIMDDGSVNHKYKRIELSTYSFNHKTQLKLIKMLQRLGIKAKIHICRFKDNRGALEYIVIKKEGYAICMRELGKYSVPCMAYKLPLASKAYSWDSTTPQQACGHILNIKKITLENASRGRGLYDIEVENNHNFVVGTSDDYGVVVSNCHHSAAKWGYRILQAMTNAYYRYGFSATAYGYRPDGLDYMNKAAIGPVIVSVSASQLVKAGKLVPVDIIGVNYYNRHRYNRNSYTKFYGEAVINNDERNKLIVSAVHALWARGKHILVAVQRVPHGELLEQMIGLLIGENNVKFVYGKDTTATRKEYKDKLANKEIPVLISTLMGEGLDLPSLSAVVNTRGEDSPISTIQMLGRVMRRDPANPNKQSAIYLDIMDRGERWLSSHSLTRESVYAREPGAYRYKAVADADVSAEIDSVCQKMKE